MTTAMQDALYDCDWIPYEVFETAKVERRTLRLHEERYKVLVVPPVEVIPQATMVKIKKFYDRGGVVIGYGFLPSQSATLGHTSDEIVKLREAIWGQPGKPGLTVCKTNAAGGRAYFLPEKPTAEQIQQVLGRDAGVRPTLEVLEGKTDQWVHVLHRVKEGRDVFFVANQNHQGAARKFKLRATAPGTPECWDAMRNEITSIPYKRVGPEQIEFELTLEPLESVLIVFSDKSSSRPQRLEPGTKPLGEPIRIARSPNPPAKAKATPKPLIEGCSWVWFPEGDPTKDAPAAMRFFRQAVQIPEGRKIKRASFQLTADNIFMLYVNGQEVTRNEGGAGDGWRIARTIDLTPTLRPGGNQLAISVYNWPEQPASHAGLIGRLVVEFLQGEPLSIAIDKTWKCSDKEEAGWKDVNFNDRAWPAARELVRLGEAPWKEMQFNVASPAAPADPFRGECVIPAQVDLKHVRACLELQGLPREGTSVKVNGAYAGGPDRWSLAPGCDRTGSKPDGTPSRSSLMPPGKRGWCFIQITLCELSLGHDTLYYDWV